MTQITADSINTSTEAPKATLAELKAGDDLSSTLINLIANLFSTADINREELEKALTFAKSNDKEATDDMDKEDAGDKEVSEVIDDFIALINNTALIFGFCKKHNTTKLLNSTKLELNPDMSLKSFPLTISVPAEAMSKKVGTKKVIEFITGAQKAFTPIIQAKVKDKFEERFPKLSSEYVGRIYKSEADFIYKLEAISEDGTTVTVKEMIWNDLKNQLEETEFEETMNATVFQEEFSLDS